MRTPLDLEIYNQLWKDAVSAFAQGKPDIDPHLSDRAHDLRRGVTIAARPSRLVRDKISDYMTRVAAVCPEQYFYRPDELHVTVLSIISGSELWRREMRHLVACRALITEVLSRQPAFRIKFHGITASRASVMIQGFPAGDRLERIRNELREAFARGGFDRLLDRRYKISTAHITAMRFRHPLVDTSSFLARLEQGRQQDFGEMLVTDLQLVWGDWYASAESVRTLQQYRLRF